MSSLSPNEQTVEPFEAAESAETIGKVEIANSPEPLKEMEKEPLEPSKDNQQELREYFRRCVDIYEWICEQQFAKSGYFELPPESELKIETPPPEPKPKSETARRSSRRIEKMNKESTPSEFFDLEPPKTSIPVR
ncbi:MAG: hypothetical protein EZS28_054200, partial [Streblomastix strix]